MKFPVIELVDRYTIAQVKHEHTHGANQAELDFYSEQIQELDTVQIQHLLDQLTQIHRHIWNLEDDFKKYRETNYSLEEIGRRSLIIRDLNQHRVAYKNQIAAAVGCAVREIKQDHASEIIRPR
jgi:TolA-binding protein